MKVPDNFPMNWAFPDKSTLTRCGGAKHLPEAIAKVETKNETFSNTESCN